MDTIYKVLLLLLHAHNFKADVYKLPEREREREKRIIN